MKKSRHQNKGFSLFELIVILGIIAILAATSLPALSTMMANMRLGGAARDIHSLLQQARLRAPKEQTFVVVDFDPDGDGNLSGDYIAFVDNDDTGTALFRDSNEEVFLTGSLPGDVWIENAAFVPASPVTLVCFDRNGYPIDSTFTIYSGSIGLKNSLDHTRIITLTASGNVSIQ